MGSIFNDTRLGLRQLRRSPGFAVTAILTLALGIGATTAIFTLVYDVMLRPLPYPHAERLAVMEEQVAEYRDIYPTLPMNANNFAMWQQNNHSVQSMAVMRSLSMPLGNGGHPLQVEILSSTPGIFSVLSADPELGRAFAAEEAQPGHEHVAVLMNDVWRTQFQSDRQILGKSITLNGFPYTVIGVMPRSFHLPPTQSFAVFGAGSTKPVAAIVPLAFSKEDLQQTVGSFNYAGLAQLKQGVSFEQANADINALQHTITAGLSGTSRATLSAVITPFQQMLIGKHRAPLLILLGAVAALLLVGCVNITNLLLARAAGRRQQMAVAAALGARPVEMLRLSLRETVLLVATGGALGILLSAILVPLMQRFLPPALNFRGPLHLDWAGALCALVLAVMATLLAGAVPAWIGSRTQPAEVLHSESRLATESHSSKRMRHILVAAEVAVSVALVLMTGLVTLSLMRMLRIDRGFDSSHTMTAEINLPRRSYADRDPRSQFYHQMLDRIRQLPGVDYAGITSTVPLAGDEWIDMIRDPGDGRPLMQLPSQHFRWISPGYFEAIHLPIIAGNPLRESDKDKRYALVSELTAKTMWPGRDPIGQQFTRGGTDEQPFTVVGVVKDARTVSLAASDPMMVYVPYWYRANSAAGLVVSTRQDPAEMADAIRKAVWSVDPEVAVPTVRSLDGIIGDSVANRRFEMDLLLLFAVSALLLAGLGIYGVVTYSVVQREREIGLRIALGARRANIYGLVLREGLVPVALGAAAGLAIAFALTRLAESLLFEVNPHNPAIAIASVCVLLAIGVAACLLPASRASAVEPMQALRTE